MFISGGICPARKARLLIAAGMAPPGLHVKGNLNLSKSKWIEALPQGLRVDGDLIMSNPYSYLEWLDMQEHGSWTNFVSIYKVPCPSLLSLPDGLHVEGNLILFRCIHLKYIPNGLHVGKNLILDDCFSLANIPKDLHVGGKILLTNTRRPPVKSVFTSDLLASSDNASPPHPLVRLGWYRSEYAHSERVFVCCNPHTLTAESILRERNIEIRRALLKVYGLERFMQKVKARVLDQDYDGDSKRKLLHIRQKKDEDIVCLEVRCPSTQAVYIVRVPPHMHTCKQAAAWIAGFDDENHYKPEFET